MAFGTKRRAEESDFDDNISSILTDLSVKESKIVIADFDSLVHMASYPGKDEWGINNPPYTEADWPLAEWVLKDNLEKIVEEIEKYFKIESFYICVKGNNNFRKQIYPEYKSKRPPEPPIVKNLRDVLIRDYDAIPAPYGEADDMVYTLSDMIQHQGIILSIDKDLYQIPSIFFDYKKRTWSKVSEEEARYNLAVQMLIGDNGDGVNLTKGIGKAKTVVLKKGMTNFQYIKVIFPFYQKIWKELAKEKMKLAYKLLSLHKVKIPGINDQN